MNSVTIIGAGAIGSAVAAIAVKPGSTDVNWRRTGV